MPRPPQFTRKASFATNTLSAAKAVGTAYPLAKACAVAMTALYWGRPSSSRPASLSQVLRSAAIVGETIGWVTVPEGITAPANRIVVVDGVVLRHVHRRQAAAKWMARISEAVRPVSIA